jgi:type IV secretory pathway VirD2 relaxase
MGMQFEPVAAYDCARHLTRHCAVRVSSLAGAASNSNGCRMAHDEDNFRIRPGKVRDRGGARLRTRRIGEARRRPTSFIGEVQQAIRRSGGNPNRQPGIGERSGRFNARGRGAKVAASFPRDGGGWSRDGSGVRCRARRVVIKARVVKPNAQGSRRGPKMRGAVGKAVDAHLRYLERDGVTRDGERGQAYSSIDDHADGRAFIERGREDRHQFRFIVAPEDAAEMEDLRGFTRSLMHQVEADLGTALDWVAVDHHNTGHPHTHILVRGITDDGKILNIAGDYIAHGVRHRASELATLELGPQTELDVARRLASEVDAERLTRLDRMLIEEQRDQGVIDLRPGEGLSFLIRENRPLLIDRMKRLARYGLASENEPGRWTLSDRAEATLKELGERNDIIKTMHRALTDHGLAEGRGVSQYASHGGRLAEPVIGRVVGKGLAGDEMGERVYLVVDGVDGRVHHIEFADASRLEDVGGGMIVETAPVISGPRASDRNIALVAEGDGGSYRPSRHLAQIRDRLEATGKDPDAFIRSHVRRLEALRRAGHVERVDADHWKIPQDVTERGMAYDLSKGGGYWLSVRTLSTLDLERQVGSDGATWLDRELASRNRTPLVAAGFGREVTDALERRRQSLVNMGYATRLPDGRIQGPKDLVATLERAEIARVGSEMAAARKLTFRPPLAGEHVSGRLLGSANLASWHFAMIETLIGDGGLGFSLVPWQPVLDRRIGQHNMGVMRGDGRGIDWSFGRNRGLGF